MEGAIFGCPAEWLTMLPPGIRRAGRTAELTEHVWDILVLTSQGCAALGAAAAVCRILLAPGECPPVVASQLGAEKVITYGMSARDSLTLSSLTEPVLCVQRVLPRPDGTWIEPQEFPLPELPGRADRLLPLLGARLLQMPLTEALTGLRIWKLEAGRDGEGPAMR